MLLRKKEKYGFAKEQIKKKIPHLTSLLYYQKVIRFFFKTQFMAMSVLFGIRAFKTELNKVL